VRNELYRHLVRVIQAKKPKFFLAENVKGLTTLCKGEVFKMILDDFANLGYSVSHRILNAADFGVPQTRQRVFIVGVRKDIPWDYVFPTPTRSRDGENGIPKWVSVSEALKELPDPDTDNTIPNHTYSKYKLNINGYIGHRLLDPDKPAPTVTARGDNRGGVVILPHPNGKRRMSCRELATVQSFPVDYEFVGNASSVYRQIGNAVPPLLAYAVAKQFDTYEEREGEKC
ncbi:MAG: DNA cytosine methyltransferase, partial [bacterium]